jgi:carbon storage regulator CsrA
MGVSTVLILSRKNGQGLIFRVGDHEIRLDFRSKASVRVGIDAPREVAVIRQELESSVIPPANRPQTVSKTQ